MKKLLKHLEERIVGRTSLNDVYDPLTEELLVEAGGHINDAIAKTHSSVSFRCC